MVRRALSVLRPRPLRNRSGWAWGVPIIAICAGFLFTLSANTAAGTVLREDRRLELGQLIDNKQRDVDVLTLEAQGLRSDVDKATAELAKTDGPIAEQQARAASYAQAAGLTPLRGPGLTVKLDDSPKASDGSATDGVAQDQLVIHQQDVQAVVNALWAGGAEAITIMDVRVISTSAVRCVGNTLLLHGRRYSPVFVIRAIGDPQRLRTALDSSPGVRAFDEAARIYGLTYSVANETDILAPAYRGSIDLRYATVPD
ncbi:membrane protein [Rhizocola hellebori]|uniref:Membrane protein n=1 Tax=Rhizocola hellebori TaxID=1392758 RepID=A0A8J3Q8K9_9ACTN|nr:membrane protein [Rhizocola hellebori]